MSAPDFTIGVEEEYLLIDRDSLALAEAPPALMEACAAELQDQVSPEFLQCQIEIGTRVCADAKDAREDLKRLRASVAKQAAKFNLAPIAASCHPIADWKDQNPTDKDRYQSLERDLAGVVRRLLICGMHVHVGLNDDALRVDLMPQLSYFLPHLLALTGSSPYWQGRDTGLASYRLTVFDNLPRTGLPPEVGSWAEYERIVGLLTNVGVIEDSSKIWWDLRPSHRFPTLEARICDVCPRLEHTVAVAALIQALTRMLWRLKAKNQRWRTYDRFLIAENRWRAQRYGMTEGMIDFGEGVIKPFADLVGEMQELVAEDAAALGSEAEIAALSDIVASGASAQRQRSVYEQAVNSGGDHDAGLQAVVLNLMEEFHADL